MNPRNRSHLDVALPNKVFEYLAGGLPVLAFPHKTIKTFIDHHKVGHVVHNLDDMPLQLHNEEIDTVKRTTVNARHRFTIENTIDKLIHYYTAICTSMSSSNQLNRVEALEQWLPSKVRDIMKNGTDGAMNTRED